MSYYYFLSVIIMLLLIKIFFDSRKIKELKNLLKKIAEKNEELIFDFNNERDFKFMHHLITFELTNCLDTELMMVNEQRQDKLLKDDDLKSYVTIVSKASMEKMSKAYRDKLVMRYFGSNEKLINYITEYAYSTAFKLFSQLNKNKINKIRKLKDANHVLNENGKKNIFNKEQKDI